MYWYQHNRRTRYESAPHRQQWAGDSILGLSPWYAFLFLNSTLSDSHVVVPLDFYPSFPHSRSRLFPRVFPVPPLGLHGLSRYIFVYWAHILLLEHSYEPSIGKDRHWSGSIPVYRSPEEMTWIVYGVLRIAEENCICPYGEGMAFRIRLQPYCIGYRIYMVVTVYVYVYVYPSGQMWGIQYIYSI